MFLGSSWKQWRDNLAFLAVVWLVCHLAGWFTFSIVRLVCVLVSVAFVSWVMNLKVVPDDE